MFTHEKLRLILKQYPEFNGFFIAYSGGLDSQVLLHALSHLFPSTQLRAIHINHGWHHQADEWATICQQTCLSLGISCEVIPVDAQSRPGESPEARARQARYAAISERILAGSCLLTAHHRHDQAETLLLQLLRGSGLKGLASMPIFASFAKGYHLRPLLGFSRTELYQYAKAQQLRWIEDSSNAQLRFDRNFVRHRVFPIIQQRWPQLDKTLARVSQHVAEAQNLLQELAYEDWVKIQGPSPDTLRLSRLLDLNPARRRNVLRYWLSQLHFPLPSQMQLQQIERLLISKESTFPQVRWGQVQLRRYRNFLYVLALEKESLQQQRTTFQWSLDSTLHLSGIGLLEARRVLGQGMACSAIEENQVIVSFREGGERFHSYGRCGSHPLKKLFQEWGVPPWKRQGVPLIYYQEKLVAIVGYGIHAHFSAKKNEWGFLIQLK